MLPLLLILFIGLPLVDLWLLFRVGEILTFFPTLACVILTGVVGAAIAKRQGISTITRIQQELAEGRMPTTQLGEGILILLAAAVLITPGFITDAFGLLLLVPPIRRLFLKGLTAYFASRVHVTTMHGGGGSPFVHVRSVGFDDGPYADPYDPSPRPPFANEAEESSGGMKYVKNEAMDAPKSRDA
ncbi:MAG TPA: FxsA family protein [Phycisphaerae bacterium]|nr:FxsA family protein [Phycisphaerae bacterium]HRW51453.1 FxsA family protein [Phycisphaerae bacterium]